MSIDLIETSGSSHLLWLKWPRSSPSTCPLHSRPGSWGLGSNPSGDTYKRHSKPK